jgi:hypothetical protein
METTAEKRKADQDDRDADLNKKYKYVSSRGFKEVCAYARARAADAHLSRSNESTG